MLDGVWILESECTGGWWRTASVTFKARSEGKTRAHNFREGFAKHVRYIPAFCIWCTKPFRPTNELAMVDPLLPASLVNKWTTTSPK